jgi:dipeptide transport system permease protein
VSEEASLLRYMIGRIVSMFVTLYIIITLTFFLMHGVPGGPYDFEGQDLSPDVVQLSRRSTT